MSDLLRAAKRLLAKLEGDLYATADNCPACGGHMECRATCELDGLRRAVRDEELGERQYRDE